MTRRSATEQAAREERLAAIRTCCHCDECGWQLNTDGTPVDPAVRCDHGAPTTPPAVQDITELLHTPDLFSEPRHQPDDAKEQDQ